MSIEVSVLSLNSSSMLRKKPTDIVSDESLAQKLAHGDEQAYSILYQKYKNIVYNYVMTILNYNGAEAVEVTAEVFVQVFTYCQTKTIRTNFKSFVYRTAHNVSVNWIQKYSGKEAQRDDEQLQNVQDTKEKQVDRVTKSYEQEIVQHILKQIDAKYSEVLYLYYYEKKDYEQIAKIIGSNKNTVGTLINRAKKKANQIAQTYGYEI